MKTNRWVVDHPSKPVVRLAMLLGCAALLAPAAIANTVIFSDDFNGPALDPSWQVQPGQGSYALVGGSLRYSLQGPQSSPRTWITTALILDMPFTGTDWEVDTKATFNLYWFDSLGFSSGAQAPEMTVGFDSALPYSDYAGFNRLIDAWYSSNILGASYFGPGGSDSNANLLDPADSSIVNNIAGGTYWLRMTRHGGLLTLDYSRDGTNFATALTENLSNPTGTYNRLQLSATTWASVGSYTDYDFVTITALDPVPEPASFGYLAMGLGVLGLGIRIRRT